MEQLNIFQIPFRGLIVSNTGGGKSTILYNLIRGPLHRKFDRVYLFTINRDYDPKYKRMGIPSKRMYDDYDAEELEDIFYSKKADNKQWLIILDDVMADKDFNSPYQHQFLIKLWS